MVHIKTHCAKNGSGGPPAHTLGTPPFPERLLRSATRSETALRGGARRAARENGGGSASRGARRRRARCRRSRSVRAHDWLTAGGWDWRRWSRSVGAHDWSHAGFGGWRWRLGGRAVGGQRGPQAGRMSQRAKLGCRSGVGGSWTGMSGMQSIRRNLASSR